MDDTLQERPGPVHLHGMTIPASLVEFPRFRSGSLLISFVACSAILITFLATSEQFLHWFVVPLVLCGTIIGQDAVDWLRGRLGLLDPVGLLGIFGFHFFFMAPLLHVHWDYWMSYIRAPSDWKPWLGGMAILNCVGLLVYRLTRGRMISVKASMPKCRSWRLDRRKFGPTIMLGLLLTALLQLWVYQMYGGITGYILSFNDARDAGDPSVFQGMGILFSLSESFPILAMMAFVFYARKARMARSWIMLSLALIVCFLLLMLFGGLRGHRGNIVWNLFWAAGLIHVWVRPIPKSLSFLGLAFLVGFLYLYGFYKDAGFEGLATIENNASPMETQLKSGRSLQTAVLGDLGRSDVQAYLLYRLWPTPIDYEYAWGRTYLATLSLLVPRALWPDRPVSKAKEGTDALYGRNAYLRGQWNAQNVYGLAGETMLNFGVLPVPLAFAVLGLTVKVARRLLTSLDKEDSRLFLMPFMAILGIDVLTADTDNLLVILVKYLTVPTMVVVASSAISYVKPAHPPVFR
jgi:hypothetical protein